jgi:Tol biopolymer transport system component
MPAMPTPRMTQRPIRLALFGFAILTGLLFTAPVAGASPASYKGSSADGKVVFFETNEPVVPGDTDTKRDVYERSYDDELGIKSYVTREVSLGPAGGNDAYNALFEKASADGTLVFFSTEESMVEADTDHRSDVYMRNMITGTTTLVSVGEPACAPACGNGPVDAGFAGASADGNKVFFVSEERLAAADTDNSVDIYVRDLAGETTKLVSAGGSSCAPACGNGAFPVALRGISADGTHAYFTTAESLSSADTDSAFDIYARDLTGETTTLVSRGGEGCALTCGNSGAVPVFQGSSANGSRVFFTTDEPMVGADKDTATDIYARDLPSGPTILISGGSSSTETASFSAATADGAHVFFTTAEALVLADDDNANDVYEWSGGTLELVTSAKCVSACGATFDAVSSDAGTVLFSTSEQLSLADTDSSSDIYSQQTGGGEPVLVSLGSGCGGCGNGPADARFARASADASHLVFTSSEVLSPEDGDAEDDIYARDVAGEETSLITTSPSFCPLKKGNCGATFVGASVDGVRVFFTTVERFTLEDGDNEVDVYERFLGDTPAEDVTRLVSTGNSPDLELGPPAPKLEGTNPASPSASTAPKVLGEAKAGSTVKLYTTSNCSGEPVAHGSAAQLASPGIGVSVGVGETAKFWATAEAEGFVSLCGSPISYTQQNPASEGGGGGGTEGGTGTGGGGGSGGGTIKPKISKPTAEQLSSYVTPHTRITFAPASKTRSRNPVFRFLDATGQAGTRFSCKVDHHPWKRCGSPLKLKKLTNGRHTLEIKAVNGAGTPELHPAVRRFKVVAG